MSFELLKQNRTAAINKLVDAAEKLGGGAKSYSDDRYWNPTLDKVGNGFAVLRLLPAAAGQDLPWTRYWDHGFKGPTGRWYIEKSLTSIGQDDPCAQSNALLWNSGLDSDKEIARERKRRLHYVVNVLIVSDPGNPQNEGKVMLWKFGKKIFDKIMDIMQPQFQDEQPVNPFDFWTGANFKLKIRQVEGYRNYDKSEFDKPSELFDGDEDRLKDVYESLHSLSEYTDPSQYKTYDELKRKLIEVIGAEAAGAVVAQAPVNTPSFVGVQSAAPAPEIHSVESSVPSFDDDDDDESLSYFAKLAQG